MNRHFLRLACIAFVAAMALGCDSHGSPVALEAPDRALDRAGAIHGTVSLGGSPVGGARVSLWEEVGDTRDEDLALILTATSGMDGLFTFAGVPRGQYLVTALVGGASCVGERVYVPGGQTAAAAIACT